MLVNKFKKIFEGQNRAHGIFISSGEVSDKNKIKGSGKVIQEPITDALWQKHLKGEGASLGVIPINDDSKCKWGCIDVDTYPLDHKKIAKDIKSKKIPLVVFRSKSGGAHLFLFTTEFIPAVMMRKKLQEFASNLGYASCEIFPKQIEIKVDRGDTGNFLNLPYFAGENSTRYAYDESGNALTIDKFVDYYDNVVVKPEDFKKLKAKIKEKENEEISDGPPCLQTMMSLGVPEGGRDEALYQYTVYAKRKWSDENEWALKVDEFNRDYMQPPLSSAQVMKTINQHKKQDYQYKCKVPPMCNHCNSTECSIRKFGIGEDYASQLSDLRKFQSDQSIWFMNIDGKPIELNTDELYSQSLFLKRCIDEINIIPFPEPMPQKKWIRLLNELLSKVQVIEMPREITKAGRFDSLLNSFLDETPMADSREQIKLGNVLYEKDEKTEQWKAYFKMEFLINFLEEKKKFKGMTTTEMAAHIRLKRRGGDHRLSINNKTEFVWMVPHERSHETSFSVPDMDDGSEALL